MVLCLQGTVTMVREPMGAGGKPLDSALEGSSSMVPWDAATAAVGMVFD